MSYNLSLTCGCVVYVSCHPLTRVAHTRVIEARGAACSVRRHEVGLRLNLWELLPQPPHCAPIEASEPGGNWSDFRL